MFASRCGRAACPPRSDGPAREFAYAQRMASQLWKCRKGSGSSPPPSKDCDSREPQRPYVTPGRGGRTGPRLLEPSDSPLGLSTAWSPTRQAVTVQRICVAHSGKVADPRRALRALNEEGKILRVVPLRETDTSISQEVDAVDEAPDTEPA